MGLFSKLKMRIHSFLTILYRGKSRIPQRKSKEILPKEHSTQIKQFLTFSHINMSVPVSKFLCLFIPTIWIISEYDLEPLLPYHVSLDQLFLCYLFLKHRSLEILFSTLISVENRIIHINEKSLSNTREKKRILINIT